MTLAMVNHCAVADGSGTVRTSGWHVVRHGISCESLWMLVTLGLRCRLLGLGVESWPGCMGAALVLRG